MVCRKCKSEWKIGTGIQIRTCPFCGASLAEPPRFLTTAEEVLCEMVRTFGPGILLEEQRMLGIFSDLAPQLAGPRRLLGYLVECDGPRKLTGLQNSTREEQNRCVQVLVARMQQELFVDAESARNICNSFLCAVVGPRTETVREVSKPSVEFRSRRTAQTAPERDKAASDTGTEQVKTWVRTARARLEQNPEEAFSLFLKAAKHEDEEAQFQVGKCYILGTGTRKDPERGVQWYFRAAGNGHVEAMRNLGLCFEAGEGVPKDLKQALDFFQRAAERGDAAAQCRLARLYERGLGTKADPDRAFFWYRKSAQQEYAEAQYFLAQCYLAGIGIPKNQEEMVYWFGKSARNGYPDAMMIMGVLCENGIGIRADPDQALRWYEESVKQGSVAGLYYLGHCRMNGIGCPVMPRLGAVYYLEALKKGDRKALDPLIRYYATCGNLTAEDRLRIRNEVLPLSRESDDPAMRLQLVLRLADFPEYRQIAVDWIHTYAEAEDPESMNWLAVAYRNGTYVPKDLRKSENWERRYRELKQMMGFS